MLERTVSALAAIVLFVGGPAAAKDLAYAATLSGHTASTETGSKATGQASILVHPGDRTLDLTLDVQGLTLNDLWSQLVKAPMGPIHLHLYGSHDHADPNSSLLFPLPMGETYSATPTGFRVVMKNYPYAEGALRLRSDVTFDDFVKSLDGGKVVLNIHTNAKTDGEISGDVVPVQS